MLLLPASACWSPTRWTTPTWPPCLVRFQGVGHSPLGPVPSKIWTQTGGWPPSKRWKPLNLYRVNISINLVMVPVVKNPPANAGDARDAGSIRVGKISQRRKWWHTPVFLSGKFHGQRRLEDYSPWGCKRVRRDLETKKTTNLFS